ncbi:MAG TPA: hypothetical protein VIZ31_10780, partial [Vicinamibacteria bacterium]
RLVGVVVTEDAETVTFRTTSGLELTLAVSDIVSRGPATTATAALEPARRELSDPNDSRLLFAPTGRPLRKGDGYFSDHYVLVPGVAYGLTDHVSVSGGVSVIPSLGFDEQLFYVSSSVGWRFQEKAAFSLGGLYATGTEANEAGALLFGIASFGPSDRSLSLGLGLATTRNEEYLSDERGNYTRTESSWSFRDAPVLMVGGTFRVGKRLSLVTESWLFPGGGFELSQQPFGVGLRFFGERLSVDVGLVLVAEVLDEGFPIPWLSFSYHFGPSRKAASRQAAGGFSRTASWRPRRR